MLPQPHVTMQQRLPTTFVPQHPYMSAKSTTSSYYNTGAFMPPPAPPSTESFAMQYANAISLSMLRAPHAFTLPPPAKALPPPPPPKQQQLPRKTNDRLSPVRCISRAQLAYDDSLYVQRYREYLEEKGVMSTLSAALGALLVAANAKSDTPSATCLFEASDWSDDPVCFIAKRMGAATHDAVDADLVARQV